MGKQKGQQSDRMQAALEFVLSMRRQFRNEPAVLDAFMDELQSFREGRTTAAALVETVQGMVSDTKLETAFEGLRAIVPSAALPAQTSAQPQRVAESTKCSTTASTSKAVKRATEPATEPAEPARAQQHEQANGMPIIKSYFPEQEPDSRKKRKRGEGLRETPHKDMVGRQMSEQQLYLASMKQQLQPARLSETWALLLERIKAIKQQMEDAGPAWIPVIDFADIDAGTVSDKDIAQLRRTGVFKVRNTIPKELASCWNDYMALDMKRIFDVEMSDSASYDYMYSDAEPGSFAIAPPQGGLQEIYYSRAQFEARQHANMVKCKEWCTRLWKWHSHGKCHFIPDHEVMYIDRFRNRLPNYDKQSGLKDHIDNGSLSRWVDPVWHSQVYKHIMAGELEKFDPWDAQGRAESSESFFRSMQGWLALTPQGEGQGSLWVVPMLVEGIASILLRSFRQDVPMHCFCGVNDCGLTDTIEVSKQWHSNLLKARMSIGHMEPGDTVWWHPDLIHAAEEEHRGPLPSNVLYIPAAPLCIKNARYLVRQREHFLSGITPPDFPLQRTQPYSMKMEDLSLLGLRQMGLVSWSETKYEGCSDEVHAQGVAMKNEIDQILFPDGHANFKHPE